MALLCLDRIGDKHAMAFRQLVHARAGGEIIGVLGAAMQHHKQRPASLRLIRGHIQLVVPLAGMAGELLCAELSAILTLLAKLRVWADLPLRASGDRCLRVRSVLTDSPRGWRWRDVIRLGALASQRPLNLGGSVGKLAGLCEPQARNPWRF